MAALRLCSRRQALILGLAAGFYVAAAVLHNVADFDLWGYLAFGRLFWEQPGFPYQDPFSYMPTREVWIYHEWLTGVLFYPLFEHLGGAGLQVLKYLLAGAMAVFVYQGGRLRQASACTVLIVMALWSPFVTFGFSPVRAQVFTYAFFALTLLLLESCRLHGGWKKLWLLPPLMLLWANLHGGFLSGLAMPGVYGAWALLQRKSPWPWWGALLASGLVTLLNPYGLDYWLEMLEAVSMPRPEIVEWQSLWTMLQGGEYQGHALLFCALAAVAFVPALTRFSRSDPALPVLLVTCYMGMSHVRHLVFFALACGVYAPSLLEGVLAAASSKPEVVRRWRWLGFVWLLLAPLALLDGSLTLAQRLREIPPLQLAALARTAPQDDSLLYPVGAMEFIRKHELEGNILSTFAWGEYLLWELSPKCKVGFDGRYETVYPPEICKAYFDCMRLRPGWREYLQRWPHDLLLFSPGDDLYYVLGKEPHWLQVYADQNARLFARRSYWERRKGEQARQ